MKERLSMLTSCILLVSLSLTGCSDSSNNTGKNSGTDVTNQQVNPQVNPQVNQQENQQATPEANTVFTHGKIYTVNNKQLWAEAVAIKAGEIIFVGDNQSIKQYIGKDSQVFNLNGKMMMPGIHDVHIHPLESGSDATHFSLNEDETDVERYQSDIVDAATENPDANWLIGYGHRIESLLAAERSPREILDDAVPDRPVIIMEQTSHSMWLNSKALALANISGQSSDPVGGVISRDEHGQPDGILYDNAGNLVMDIAMLAQQDAAARDYSALVEYTMPELNKQGITSISDARTYWQRDHLSTWQKAERNDRLTLRVSLGLWAYPQANDELQINQLISLYQANPMSLLKINQVKFYMDGILINTTAAMHEPYQVNWLDLYQNKGLNYFSQQRLQKYIKALEPTGFDFNIHAIGDRGISEALNAIETASNGDARHRITHLEVVAPEDYPRFAQLNVIADAQVAGEFTKPEYWSDNIDFIGVERADRLVPIGSLADNNARITLSSDWNVSTFNPFVGISNAISRSPEEISLTNAIEAYTINGAYAMRQDHIVGSIVVGKRADLIVLDRDLFNSSAAQIKNTQVVMTLLDGEIIYQR